MLFALQAVEQDPRKLIIVSDSKYAAGIVNSWGWLWRETGERRENMDLIDPILDAVDARRLRFKDDVNVLRVYSHLASDSALGLKTFDPDQLRAHPFWTQGNQALVLTLCNAYADKLAKAGLPLKPETAKISRPEQTKDHPPGQTEARDRVSVKKIKLRPESADITVVFGGKQESFQVEGALTCNEAHLQALWVAADFARKHGCSEIGSYSKYAVQAVAAEPKKQSKNTGRIACLRDHLADIRVVLEN